MPERAELRESLPADVVGGRDGSRVLLLPSDSGGGEHTVCSLSDVWLTLHDWERQRRVLSSSPLPCSLQRLNGACRAMHVARNNGQLMSPPCSPTARVSRNNRH